MDKAEGAALVIGPGPVTLAHGPAFQYLAARGCVRLRRMGLRVLVLEDNPATMMDLGGSDGELFIEPVAAEVVRLIAERYEVGSVWYGLGGMRGWKLALRLAGEGWHEEAGVQAPDLDDRALWLCGDRSLLREALEGIGLANPDFYSVSSMSEAQAAAECIGFPLLVRPNFSSGGWGAGIAYNLEDYPLLLEEAMRESPTGEVLVERALEGWRKYIAVALRDAAGKTAIAGIMEQLEPLPLHDEDAVIVYPPQSCGGEGEYALREAARQVMEGLDLVGVAEIKLASAPGWEALYVLDVNPRPWRNTPLLETAMGKDLIAAHLDLVVGKPLAHRDGEAGKTAAFGAVVAIPRIYHITQGGEEGYLPLGCRSMGRAVFGGEDAHAAAAAAWERLRATRPGEGRSPTANALETLLRRGGRRAQGRGTAGSPAGSASRCIWWPAADGLSGGMLLVGAENAGPGGGSEANAACMDALRKWREGGGRAVVYTPDPGFALLALEEADAVFLGPLEAEAVAEAARRSEATGITLHFGGRAAMAMAAALARRGLDIRGLQAAEEGGKLRDALQRLRSAGVSTVDFRLSSGMEDGAAVLQRAEFPLLATVAEDGSRLKQRMIYAPEDGLAFLREQRGEVLWRPLREDAQEVMVEAVACGGEHVMVLWEQVDAAGIYSTDGLAVYPPCYLTSEQEGQALSLARRAIDALGWRGNLSLRINLHDGEALLWSVSPGPSANLPFLQRASRLPLAALGMAALAGEEVEAVRACEPCSAVRAPIIPFGAIADHDIMPSAQRRSSGAAMGMASDPGTALAKAMWSQGLRPQPGGRALLSVANREKRRAVLLARELLAAGYALMATRGTANALEAAGIEVETVNKLREGRPNVLDLIRNGKVGLVVNIPRGKHPHSDGFYIRAASVRHGIPCMTNMEVALALARGLRRADPPTWEIRPLDEYAATRHEVRRS